MSVLRVSSRARAAAAAPLAVAPFAAALLVAALAVSFATPRAAFAFSAQGHHWPNTQGQPVPYMIHPDGAPGITDDSDNQAVRRAFATWQEVSCSYLSFAEQQWQDPRTVANDGLNHIFWVSQAAEWPTDQRATIALTFTFYRTTDKIITDSDITNNAVNYTWTTTDGQAGGTRVDLETIILHEIGHFFGLDHSNDTTAVMFPSNNKIKQRTVTNDDVNGLCSLYNNGQPAPNTPAEGGGVGAPCQTSETCASRQCVQDDAVGAAYCTQPCNSAQSGTCPTGYLCTATGSGELCLAPLPVDELCDFCSASEQCSSGLCLNVPGYNFYQSFCTRACDPTSGVPGQCPNGYLCTAVFNQGQTGGVCAPSTGVCNPQGKGGHGEPCFANGGCKSNHICIDYFAGNQNLEGQYKFCYFECGAQFINQACSDTSPVLCLPIDSIPNRAACLNISGPGGPCIPELCAPGSVCLWDENAGLDSALCYGLCTEGVCPANTQCQNVEGTGVCVPNAGFEPLGGLCDSDAECTSRTCRVYSGEQRCTQPCTTSDQTSCPTGFVCLANLEGQTTGLCWSRAFIDRNATEPDRNIDIDDLPPGFCICDTTSQCDPDCDCDPECAGGCSCTSVSGPANLAEIGLFVILAAGAVIARRRKRRN